MKFFLIHPPAVLLNDYKNYPLFPIHTTLIPSGALYEVYPIGFLSLSKYLEDRGFDVSVINLGLIRNRQQIEKILSKISCFAVGIDLHWAVHIHGALEIAKIIKSYFPKTRVIFGGFTSTFFYKEILSYNQVDYVALGDCAELPLFLLLKAIKEKSNIENIPNLAYRKGGKVVKSPNWFLWENLDDVEYDYLWFLKKQIKKANILALPYLYFRKYPMFCLPFYRGCAYNCIFCGGSKFFYKEFCKRENLAKRSIRKILEDIKKINKISKKKPIFFAGDISEFLFSQIKEFFENIKNFKNTFILEFFKPPNKDLLKLINHKNLILQISPETHSDKERKEFGRCYTTKELEDFLEYLMKTQFIRIDLFFTIGLPNQTKDSIFSTLTYIHSLYKEYKGKIRCFFAPLAPFIDPGSLAFIYPEKYGYSLIYKEFYQLKDALLFAHPAYQISYFTKYLSSLEITKLGIFTQRKIIEYEKEFGILKEKEYKILLERLNKEEKIHLFLEALLQDKIIPPLRYFKKDKLKEKFLSLYKTNIIKPNKIKNKPKVPFITVNKSGHQNM